MVLVESKSCRDNSGDAHQKRNGNQNNGLDENQRPAPSRHMKLNRLTPSCCDGPSHGGGMFGQEAKSKFSRCNQQCRHSDRESVAMTTRCEERFRSTCSCERLEQMGERKQSFELGEAEAYKPEELFGKGTPVQTATTRQHCPPPRQKARVGARLVSLPRRLAAGRKAFIAQAYRPFLLWDSNLIYEGPARPLPKTVLSGYFLFSRCTNYISRAMHCWRVAL